MDKITTVLFWSIFIPCLALASVPLSFVVFVMAPIMIVMLVPIAYVVIYLLVQRAQLKEAIPVGEYAASVGSALKGAAFFTDLAREFESARKLVPADFHMCSMVHQDNKGQYHLHSYIVHMDQSWSTQIVGVDTREIFERTKAHLNSVSSLYIKDNKIRSRLVSTNSDRSDLPRGQRESFSGNFDEDLLVSVGS